MNETAPLVGWKAIADRLGVTVRAAQRYAAFEQDPLPCYRRLRTVCLDAADLEAWLDRRREPLTDGAAESVVMIRADPRLAPVVRLFHREAMRVLERIVVASARQPGDGPAHEVRPAGGVEASVGGKR